MSAIHLRVRTVATLCGLFALVAAAQAQVRFEATQLTVPEGAERTEQYVQVPIATPAGRAASATAGQVAAGRYAIQFRLAAPRFGVSNARLECILDVPGQRQQRRALYGPDFPAGGIPLTVRFDAALPQPSPLRVYVEWSGNEDKELIWVRVFDITATRLDKGLGLTRVQAGKLLYRPGEAGAIQVAVRNFTDQDASGTLALSLTQELTLTRSLPPVTVTVPAGQEQAFELPFTCDEREYGCEATVTLSQGQTILDTRSDVFNVADNVWKVALGASGISIMGMSGYCTPESLANDLRVCRETYSNWWEKMFWPPDDWGDMTPEREEWISGQSARWEKAQNIKDFIALCKPQGIKAITYGKHGTGGPEGWELTRKHPEWFYTDEQGHIVGSFNTWDPLHGSGGRVYLSERSKLQNSPPALPVPGSI